MTEEAVFSEYLAASYDAETITFQNGADAFADMTEGYADAVVSDAANAALLLQQNPDTKLLLTREKYHNLHRFAGTAASGLPEEITDTLEAIRADGTLDALLSQYGLGGTAGTQAAD